MELEARAQQLSEETKQREREIAERQAAFEEELKTKLEAEKAARDELMKKSILEQESLRNELEQSAQKDLQAKIDAQKRKLEQEAAAEIER